jgi:type II secretory pathway component GspD/PulD (secretin)
MKYIFILIAFTLTLSGTLKSAKHLRADTLLEMYAKGNNLQLVTHVTIGDKLIDALNLEESTLADVNRILETVNIQAKVNNKFLDVYAIDDPKLKEDYLIEVQYKSPAVIYKLLMSYIDKKKFKIIPSSSGILVRTQSTYLGELEELIAYLDTKDSRTIIIDYNNITPPPGLSSLSTDRVKVSVSGTSVIVSGLVKDVNELVPGLRSLDRGDLSIVTRQIHIRYRDAEELANNIRNSVISTRTPTTITVDKPTNTIIISTTAGKYRKLLTTIKRLDTRIKQVEFTIIVYKLSFDNLMNIGTDYSFFSVKENRDINVYGLVNTILQQGVTKSTINANISLLKSTGFLKTVNKPKITVLNNHKSKIYVGNTVSIISTGASSSQSTTTDPANVPATFERLAVGFKLNIKPTILSNNDISAELDIKDEAIINDELEKPNVASNEISTTLRMRNNTPIVLGGQIKTTDKSTQSGLPIFQSVPLLRDIFSKRHKNKIETMFLITITPHILGTRRINTELEESRLRHNTLGKSKILIF